MATPARLLVRISISAADCLKCSAGEKDKGFPQKSFILHSTGGLCFCQISLVVGSWWRQNPLEWHQDFERAGREEKEEQGCLLTWQHHLIFTQMTKVSVFCPGELMYQRLLAPSHWFAGLSAFSSGWELCLENTPRERDHLSINSVSNNQ